MDERTHLTGLKVEQFLATSGYSSASPYADQVQSQ